MQKSSFLLAIVVMLGAFPVAHAQLGGDNPGSTPVMQAVWLTFKDNPNMVDQCAVKLAWGVDVDPQNGWPAYCNDFKSTPVVQQRVAALKREIASIKSKSVRAKLAAGQLWVGASSKEAELSWGRPKSINRTVIASGTSEQWVYGASNYLYMHNGRVSGIQN